jgi:hypothetical protein
METLVDFLALFQVQYGAHLFFCVAARSRGGHGQATRNAVGREKEVAGTRLEETVKIDGESCIPLSRGCCLHDFSAKNVSKHKGGSDEMDYSTSHIRSRFTLWQSPQLLPFHIILYQTVNPSRMLRNLLFLGIAWQCYIGKSCIFGKILRAHFSFYLCASVSLWFIAFWLRLCRAVSLRLGVDPLCLVMCITQTQRRAKLNNI